MLIKKLINKYFFFESLKIFKINSQHNPRLMKKTFTIIKKNTIKFQNYMKNIIKLISMIKNYLIKSSSTFKSLILI